MYLMYTQKIDEMNSDNIGRHHLYTLKKEDIVNKHP